MAAGVSVATVETPHLFTSAPSLVLAIADRVVADAPGAVVRAAIGSLGTTDKPALVAGIVVAALVAGAVLGLVARRRWWTGPTVMAVAGLLAVSAEAVRPSGSPAAAAAIAVAGVVVGAVALRWLLTLAVPSNPARTRSGAGRRSIGDVS